MDSTVAIKYWPVVAMEGGPSQITQEFKPDRHLGVDISVPGHLRDAKAMVVAAADGVVERAYAARNGYAVLLRHAGGWTTAYLHMQPSSRLMLAWNVGDRLRAGQDLGIMGADPTDPEGVVHLHFQVGVDGVAVDPAPYLASLTAT
jgi:murein DD-endopeptidase MepM/ murein hydrolase activator NlpD